MMKKRNQAVYISPSMQVAFLKAGDLISCSGLTSISDGDGMILDWSQGA